MKKIKIFLGTILIAGLLFSCGKATEDSSTEEIIIETEDESSDTASDSEDETSLDEDSSQESQYSHSSLIVMVEEGTNEEQVQEMCNDYNLSIMYAYDVISGYALSIDEELTSQQLDSLINSLEKYDFVLGVEKDYIMELDDAASQCEADSASDTGESTSDSDTTQSTADSSTTSANSDTTTSSTSETKVATTNVSDTDNFYAIEFTEDSDIFARINGKSYKDDCTVPVSDLRYLHVLYVGFDAASHEGEIICNKDIAEDLLEIFEDLYDAGYEIESIKLVDEYGADDETSMEANNTSCFNFRFMTGSTTKVSKHGQGLAIDINPLYNPYVKSTDSSLIIEPVTATAYADRTADFAHKIDENDLAYKLFTAHGFTWGGSWSSCQDYQHFEK